jgi:hypothetical protein
MNGYKIGLIMLIVSVVLITIDIWECDMCG